LIRLIQNILNRWIRKNSYITKILFGVKIGGGQRIHWDFTTLALKKCLLKQVQPGNDVLEVGTGPYAILSILVAKRLECNILACDINEMYVAKARKTVELNGVRVEVVRSDLFSGISEKFDIIFFNSVYIPRAIGPRIGVDRWHEVDTDWCGGDIGTEVIERFLKDAPPHLKENGKILLGYNPKYLVEELVVSLCKEYNYQITKRYFSACNPSLVYVLQER